MTNLRKYMPFWSTLLVIGVMVLGACSGSPTPSPPVGAQQDLNTFIFVYTEP